jgi:hypothetical protein
MCPEQLHAAEHAAWVARDLYSLAQPLAQAVVLVNTGLTTV